MINLLESPGDDSKTIPVYAPRRKLSPRAARIVLAVVVAGVVVATATDHAWRRRAVLSAFGQFYAMYDPWSKSMAVDFGPAPSEDFSRKLSSAASTCNTSSASAEEPSGPCLADLLSSARYGEQFRHEHLAHPQVLELRRLSDSLAGPQASPFEICDRLRQLTRHGDSPVGKFGDNALELLKQAQQATPLTCRPFAVAFVGLCVSRGYTARLIGLSRFGNGTAHAAAEVYIPELGKWVLIDPDFNMAYRRGDRWLDAWELHDAWQRVKAALGGPQDSLQQIYDKIRTDPSEAMRIAGVDIVPLGESWKELGETSLRSGSPTRANLEYFEYVFYAVRNDYLSATYPKAHPARIRQFVLLPAGDTTPPPACPEAVVAAGRDPLYWKPGVTAICLTEPPTAGSAKQIRVDLATWTPNFAGFEIRFDGTNWHPIDGHTALWALHDGPNSLEARSVNLGGLRGEVARINITEGPH
jgi:hypothetical protein